MMVTAPHHVCTLMLTLARDINVLARVLLCDAWITTLKAM